MAALGLAGELVAAPEAATSIESQHEQVAHMVRHLFALQGQDWQASRWALGVRLPGSRLDDVHEALNRGLIVRSWPMRGTVHLISAEDIGWVQAVTGARLIAGAPKRREYLGITDSSLEMLVEVAIEGLRGGNSLTRDELATLWQEAGIELQNSWRYHLVWWLCQNGHAVLGPVGEEGEPRLVSAPEWIRSPRMLDADESLAELASRYTRARGAVTTKDFCWWTGLGAREAKRAYALAADEGRLVEIQVKSPSDTPGTTTSMWADPGLLDRALQLNQRESGWQLLPAFDEHLLGYQDRSPQLDPDHLGRILPGRNGVFQATVVHDGRVVGTWKRGGSGKRELIAAPMPGLSLAEGVEALQQKAADWGRFHGVDEPKLVIGD